MRLWEWKLKIWNGPSLLKTMLQAHTHRVNVIAMLRMFHKLNNICLDVALWWILSNDGVDGGWHIIHTIKSIYMADVPDKIAAQEISYTVYYTVY